MFPEWTLPSFIPSTLLACPESAKARVWAHLPSSIRVSSYVSWEPLPHSDIPQKVLTSFLHVRYVMVYLVHPLMQPHDVHDVQFSNHKVEMSFEFFSILLRFMAVVVVGSQDCNMQSLTECVFKPKWCLPLSLRALLPRDLTLSLARSPWRASSGLCRNRKSD